MKINDKGKGALIAAITAAATLLSCGLAAASASAAGVDYLPTIGQVPTYTKFQPTADPGKNASDYFQPYWYAKNANDNGGKRTVAEWSRLATPTTGMAKTVLTVTTTAPVFMLICRQIYTTGPILVWRCVR